MFNISKTAFNMANARGFVIHLEDWEVGLHDEEVTLLTFHEMETVKDSYYGDYKEPADEYFAAYRVTEQGLFWHGACYGNTEEFPYWIASEDALRNVIKHAMAIVQ
jgi:hypothetical protein